MTSAKVNESLTEYNLYDQDFYQWIEITANLLKNRQLEKIDYENLIEELESMGRKEKYALSSNLRVILMHLLKYKYQQDKRSNSWLYTIFEHRERIRESLQDSPSLSPYVAEILELCYNKARKEASLETGLSINIFPVQCPFNLENILDENYLPF